MNLLQIDDYSYDDLYDYLKKNIIPVKYAYTASAAAYHTIFANSDNYSKAVEMESNKYDFLTKHLKNKSISLCEIGPDDGVNTQNILDYLHTINTIINECLFLDYSQELLNKCKINLKDKLNNIPSSFIQQDIEIENQRIDFDSSGSKLFVLLGNTLGNVENENFVLKNIHDSMSDEDYFLIGLTLKNNDYDIDNEIDTYNTIAFKDSILEFLKLMGIAPYYENITIKYDYSKDAIIAEYTFDKETILFDHFLFHKNDSIRCFQSRRFDRRRCEVLFTDNHFAIVDFVIDKENRHILYLLQKNKICLNSFKDIFYHHNQKIAVSQNDIKTVLSYIYNHALSSISHVVLFHSKRYESVGRELNVSCSPSSVPIITKIYFVNDEETLHSREFDYEIAKNIKNNINVKKIAVSTIPVEKHIKPEDYILVDDFLCVYYDMLDGEAIYYLSTLESDIYRIKNLLDEVYPLTCDNPKRVELKEPLNRSAKLNCDLAYSNCSKGYVDRENCVWYHSVWQYLRLIDKVSSPEWHADFYISKIKEALNNVLHPKILISGTADYSMLAYINYCCHECSNSADVYVLDLCATPLKICEWYAEKYIHNHIRLFTLQNDVLLLDEEQNTFDFICTDAFLTRFSYEDANRIVSKWGRLLKQNGKIITTIRIRDAKKEHQCPSRNIKEAYVKEAIERFYKWEPYINISIGEFEEKVRSYANKMNSINLGSQADIINLFKNNGLQMDCVEKQMTQGEFDTTLYLNIQSSKKEVY